MGDEGSCNRNGKSKGKSNCNGKSKGNGNGKGKGKGTCQPPTVNKFLVFFAC